MPFLQMTDPNIRRADSSGMYPEYLQLDLPDFLLQMAGPLTTADLDELRSEIDERPEDAAQGMSITNTSPSTPAGCLLSITSIQPKRRRSNDGTGHAIGSGPTFRQRPPQMSSGAIDKGVQR